MKGSSYRERDYAFGQAMLTVRTRTGLTQAEVAKILGVSRKAVGDWERGSSYPQTEHLKQFIAIAIQHRAFPAGHEAEEVHSLWKCAHQKALFDETWLTTLLSPLEASLTLGPVNETTASAALAYLVDWNDAPAVPAFYGREWEMKLLTGWVVAERCRVISVLGLGGIGKSALAVSLMHQLAEHFEVVIWRSLRNLPTCEEFIEDLIQMLVPESISGEATGQERRLRVLLEQMHKTRVLLVLDSVEALLEKGEVSGRMRPGFESFERFLCLAAETEHQSCVLLTSREKPTVLAPMESNYWPVRALRLARLDTISCDRLLSEKDLLGSALDRMRLIEAYDGNPLALKMVAQTIVDLFDGEIAPFLEQGIVLFGGVRDLLDEQFSRLSSLEQSLLLWLAILREPATLDKLFEVMAAPIERARILEALDNLYRHSLIERGHKHRGFTVQSMVMKYLTEKLITQATFEVQEGNLNCLIGQSLELAQVREDIRQTQKRSIILPILTQLRRAFAHSTSLKEHLLRLLRGLASWGIDQQGYGPANLVALLRIDQGNLRGLDMSDLALRGAYLRGIEMQDANLSNATLQDSIFSKPFDLIQAVAISSNGQYWAVSIGRGEVRVWEVVDERLPWRWQTYSDMFQALAFSPDSSRLAIGSQDGMIQLRDVASGALLWSGWHANKVNRLTFSPDGKVLVSAGNDSIVRLWDSQRGTLLQALSHPDPVLAITWSPNGQLITSNGLSRGIRLWEVEQDNHRAVLQGRNAPINGLPFTPDSSSLHSVSDDGSLRVWGVSHGQLVRLIQGYVSAHYDLDWNPDGDQIITGGANAQITVWEVAGKMPSKIWRNPNGAVYGVEWSPDGKRLATNGGGRVIQIWDPTTKTKDEIQEPETLFFGLAWSPNGECLASGTYLHGILVWEVNMGTYKWVGDDYPNRFLSVAWSPDGSHLASGSDDGCLYIWDTATGSLGQRLAGHHGEINSVAWSPDGAHLASAGSGSQGGEILVWDIRSGARVWSLDGQARIVHAITWGINWDTLVSGSSDGKLCWWDLGSGECSQECDAHQGRVLSLRRDPEGTRLASCGDDGAVHVWDLGSGEHLQTLRQDRPYERLNISGIRGLTKEQREDIRMLGAIEESNNPVG